MGLILCAMNSITTHKNSNEKEIETLQIRVEKSEKNSDKNSHRESFHISDEENKEKLIESLQSIKEIFEATEPLENQKRSEYLNACLLLFEFKKVQVEIFETDFFKKQMENLK